MLVCFHWNTLTTKIFILTMIAVMFVLVGHTQSQHLASLKALTKEVHHILSLTYKYNSMSCRAVVILRMYDRLDKDLCVSPVRQSQMLRVEQMPGACSVHTDKQLSQLSYTPKLWYCFLYQAEHDPACECEAVVCFCWHLLGSETHSCGGPRALLNLALFWSASFCLIFWQLTGWDSQANI